MQGGGKVQLHTFIFSALDRNEQSATCCGRFSLGGKNLHLLSDRRLYELRSVWTLCRKKRMHVTEIEPRFLHRPAHSLLAILELSRLFQNHNKKENNFQPAEFCWIFHEILVFIQRILKSVRLRYCVHKIRHCTQSDPQTGLSSFLPPRHEQKLPTHSNQTQSLLYLECTPGYSRTNCLREYLDKNELTANKKFTKLDVRNQ